ncbi:MAG: MFS transporter [Desulfobacteraceae bacterium]
MNSIEDSLGPRGRFTIVASALLALFLGAMDALVMSAAAPTIIADLGGLPLYSWVYSAFFLARAVALPIFGKLADLFNTKRLFIFSIILFLGASIAAGASPSMEFLVAARVFQGIGTGGNFALVYIVLSEVALPGKRAQTLSFASSVWGIASIIGPTLGGVIVTWFSWRWIFYINVPLGLLSLVGIWVYLSELREKKKTVVLDIAGAVCLTGSVLSILVLFMTAGTRFDWISFETALLLLATTGFAWGFYRAERRSSEPLLDLGFFRHPWFALGNGTIFFASFTIFTLFAYAPLFVQGALNKTPLEVGMAMLSLSLGWSLGSLAIGRFMDHTGNRAVTIAGALFMVAGTALTLNFSIDTSMAVLFSVFMVIGLGMGLITLSTLVMVQNALSLEDLGVATSFHQFSRSLGGTMGVGICGGLVTAGLLSHLETAAVTLPGQVLDQLRDGVEHLLLPQVQAMIPQAAKDTVQTAVLQGITSIFSVALAAAVICFILALCSAVSRSDS